MEIQTITLYGYIDLGLSSILDLSAALRELIWDFLFKRNKPILLHNHEACYARPPEARSLRGHFDDNEVDDPSQRPKSCSYEEWQKIHAEEKEAGKNFRHRLGEGINLLTICHQIYYETPTDCKDITRSHSYVCLTVDMIGILKSLLHTLREQDAQAIN
jgi:hypothetical protein